MQRGQQLGSLRRIVLWSGALLLPLLTLLLLFSGVVVDPTWAGPEFHFHVVSFTSLVALTMAVLMVVAAWQVRHTRVFFLSMAFLGIACIFFVHALTTPGVLIPGANPWVGFSARLSLLTGAVFLTLSSLNWSSRPQDFNVRKWSWLMRGYVILLVSYGLVALGTAASGSAGTFAILNRAEVQWTEAGIALILFGTTAIRYGRLYRETGTPLLAGMTLSAIFLFQSQISMAIAPVWHASWWAYHVLMLAAFIAVVMALAWQYGRNRSFQGIIEGLLLRDTIAQVERTYTEVIVALIAAVEARDPYTRGHTDRVADLATRIGAELQLDSEQLQLLRQAALLHDIGKIGIPDSILNKPGPLTPEEFDVIKEHPSRGQEIIRNVPSLWEFTDGIRHHHERLDGSGYPDGLSGDSISLNARIIAVADVFDALTSPRPYRGAWSRESALALIDEDAGHKLDQRCVTALHTVLDEPVPANLRRSAETVAVY